MRSDEQCLALPHQRASAFHSLLSLLGFFWADVIHVPSHRFKSKTCWQTKTELNPVGLGTCGIPAQDGSHYFTDVFGRTVSKTHLTFIQDWAENICLKPVLIWPRPFSHLLF